MARKSGSSKRGSSRRKKNSVTIDFTGVEMRTLIPEGEYSVKVDKVTLETSKESGNEYLAWNFRIIDDNPKHDGQLLYFNTSLQPQSLWSLRSLLETLEFEVPKGPTDLDFDELVELEMIAVVEHETYEGKKRSRLVDFMPTDEGEEDEERDVTVDEDEEKKSPKRGKKKKRDELEPLSEDEIGEMSIEELKEVVEKYDLDIDFDRLRSARKKFNAIIDALEETGHLAEE